MTGFTHVFHEFWIIIHVFHKMFLDLPYARDGRPLFSYNRSRFITAFMKVKEMKIVKFQYVISQPL